MTETQVLKDRSCSGKTEINVKMVEWYIYDLNDYEEIRKIQIERSLGVTISLGKDASKNSVEKEPRICYISRSDVAMDSGSVMSDRYGELCHGRFSLPRIMEDSVCGRCIEARTGAEKGH